MVMEYLMAWKVLAILMEMASQIQQTVTQMATVHRTRKRAQVMAMAMEFRTMYKTITILALTRLCEEQSYIF